MKRKSKDLTGRYNPKNVRVVYRYIQHLKHALGKDAKTTYQVQKYIRHYDEVFDFEDFAIFNKEKAIKFKEALFRNELSASYILHAISTLKEFFTWLERQKGYRSKIIFNDIFYLSLTRNQINQARATEYQNSYKFVEIIKAIRNMPEQTLIDKRNKAMVSLQMACTLRISELRTIKIKNLIYDDMPEVCNWFVDINPKNMEIKFAKKRMAYFIGVPQEIIDNIISWKDYLLKQGFIPQDPLFPLIPSNFNQNNLLESSIKKEVIKSSSTIRNIFRKSFEAVDLPYYKPHSFRHTLVRESERISPQHLNSIRQNHGHASINTTIQSYGNLSNAEQGRLVKEISLTEY